jgi:LacI family transcriptional regulator
VRDETRERVLEMVKKLNYHPSLSARSLAGRRSYLIGLIYENPSANYIVDVQHGAMSRCREDRFQLLMHQVTGRGEEMERDVLGLVDQTHLDGLIVTAPLSESTALIRALDRRALPFVRMAPNDVKHRTPYADMDDAGAAREMTEYLIGLGHRRIGFIVGHPDHFASGQRLLGYKAALTAHRIDFDPRYVKQGYFVFESGVDAARELLVLPDRPTAIFASNDDMAAGVIHTATEMGLSVPRDLSVAGFDDSALATRIRPALTTIRRPVRAMARLAASKLIATIEDRPNDARMGVFLEPDLIIRASTRSIDPAARVMAGGELVQP